MFKVVILLSVLAGALGATIPGGMLPQLDGRIVGGTKTTISNFPYQVSVQRYAAHACGGSIYSQIIIVTAAHCLQSVAAPALRIRAGSSYYNDGGVIVKVGAFLNHDGYNPNTMVNDIAVIRLSTVLAYSANIKNIGLATFTPPNGTPAIVSGWGEDTKNGQLSTQLQYVDTVIISQPECASNAYGYGGAILPTMICARSVGKGTCQADSGGPLVANGEQVGVASWSTGCGLSYFPGVYANVAELKNWVINAASSV